MARQPTGPLLWPASPKHSPDRPTAKAERGPRNPESDRKMDRRSPGTQRGSFPSHRPESHKPLTMEKWSSSGSASFPSRASRGTVCTRRSILAAALRFANFLEVPLPACGERVTDYDSQLCFTPNSNLAWGFPQQVSSGKRLGPATHLST